MGDHWSEFCMLVDQGRMGEVSYIVDWLSSRHLEEDCMPSWREKLESLESEATYLVKRRC